MKQAKDYDEDIKEKEEHLKAIKWTIEIMKILTKQIK